MRLRTPALSVVTLLSGVALACSQSAEPAPNSGNSAAGASASLGAGAGTAGALPNYVGAGGAAVPVGGGSAGIASSAGGPSAGEASSAAGSISAGAGTSSSGAADAGGSSGAAASGGAAANGGSSGGSVSASGSAGAGGSGSALSSGCGKAFTRPNAGALKSIAVAGVNRSYQFFVPETYVASKGYPLVITFHGGGGSAASSRAEMHLESATSPGLVVYLNYVNNGWSYADGSPDIAYYQAVREQVESAFCVDLKRVLVTGFSLGAIQTNGIGCTLGGKSVRAIVPIDGSGPYPQPAPPSEASLSCPAGTPVGDPAVMVIHGSNDTTALYKYGQWTRNYWSKHNGCMETPSNLAAPFQGCVSYAGCRAPVYFCTHSGNHEVPSSAGGWVWAFLATLP